MKSILKVHLVVSSALLFQGCANFESDPVVADKVSKIESDIKKIKEAKSYSVIHDAYIPAAAYSSAKSDMDVLRDIDIEINVSNVAFSEILKEFEDRGVLVVTPLESIRAQVYKGYKIHKTDAATALDMLTTAMGLDYDVDIDVMGRPIVTITGLKTEEYTLNLPQITTGFYLSSGSSSGGQQGGGQQGGGQGGGQQSGSQASGQGGASQDGGLESLTSMGQKSSYIKSESEFWKNLKSELTMMVSEMRPIDKSDRVDSMPGYIGQGSGDYEDVKVGNVTVNESTGRVYISAPKHIRKRVISYLKNLDAQLNTRLVIEGRLLSVTWKNNEQRGIDWSDLRAFSSDKYNVFVGNPVLGQGDLTLSSGLGQGLSATFDNALANPFFGIQDVENTFRAFSAYLSRDNNVSIVDEVSETTTSGITATSIELDDNIATIYSQSETVTSDAGTSGGGVKPEIINITTGSIFQITPIYDPKNGVIRSFVNINLKLDNGSETVTSIINSTNGSQNISSEYTETKQITMQSNSVTKSGETVILSSKTRSYEATTTEGVTKLKDTALGGLVGNGNKDLVHSKFYFLMNVRAIPYAKSY